MADTPTYEVRNANGVAIAFFESASDAQTFAARKPGCTITVRTLTESAPVATPHLLTEG